ncbi:Fe-S cluster protein [Novosphingobium sp. PC22D]|uniref:iron-sulfur cluster assembly scaffold protein n=1 Tax=Novosphingobium sp. PC22D TaxID=1962403 RepID=UPI000BF21067|nr:iron-sulfur cluster assembly scaffold protein [Novosphingobium sp. PC22D]PEQ11231.1 Fe-S cluster protein [Novosphingobium sp. PC22D]
MSATVLYTPDVLMLATELSRWRLEPGFVLAGEARSRSCGSMLRMGVDLDDQNRIARLGMQCQACAVGQAAAAIFAGAAVGRSLEAVADSADAIARWLRGEGERPDWPRLEIIDAAAAYPGRHGAIMLPWTAASRLLPSD